MPSWLVIAITGLWVINALWVLAAYLSYRQLSAFQKHFYTLNTLGNITIWGFIPFTIFFGSWVIFG